MLPVMDIPENLDGQYDPADHEPRIQDLWQDHNYFNPDTLVKKGLVDEEAETFSMVLPPPNVTGVLHTGHSMMVAIQDALTRFNRMQGKRTLWIPGTDHAAIATQSKVEKQLYENEGKNRYDLGREEFLDKVEDFAQNSHDTIVSQIKRLGASVDWSREAFTLDEKRETAVRTAFKRMYDAGLIYRDTKVVNWDPDGQTTVSDDEVEHEEGEGTLYTFRYSEDFPFAIATTRPETKLGDTAVAVHPDDDRYSEYVGEKYTIDFAGTTLEIEVVADSEIDPEFGTGAVGVTPAHSHTDADIARRHDLTEKQIINEDAEITNTDTDLDGLHTKEARKKIIDWLEENNLLENKETVEMSISTAERTGGVIEPLPKLQWFVDVNKEFTLENSNLNGIEDGESVTLKEIMQTVVESDQIEILPERFEKEYFHWIDNLRDWCISRQIWYGHRIPVWYKDGETYVGTEAPEGDGWTQDEDTLDTWFSSGLWTFSTLGWPHKTDEEGSPEPGSDLDLYHPTSVLETGYDILFFWIARMILMSGFLLGDIPFETVYLHGMVRDEQGRKMSKSLGNTIDPVEVAEKNGADALRMALVVGTTPGQDSNLSDEKVEAYSKFANKVWNASKFVLMQTPADYQHDEKPDLTDEQEDRLTELREHAAEVTENIEKFQFNLAAEKLYDYTWHTFADEIIEESKDAFYDDSATKEDAAKACFLLYEILTTELKMLHPFMPHVTEAIWSELPSTDTQLCVAEWPFDSAQDNSRNTDQSS